MLSIRKDQFDALAALQEERFIDRLVDYLRSDFDDAREQPREELRPAVVEQVRKANTYGLETEHQIAVYVTTAWLMGRNFDQDFPSAHNVLVSAVHEPLVKADWLASWTQQVFEALEQEDDA